MAYDKKTIAELEELVANLHAQIALHPEGKSSRLQLRECERWIELRRKHGGGAVLTMLL